MTPLEWIKTFENQPPTYGAYVEFCATNNWPSIDESAFNTLINPAPITNQIVATFLPTDATDRLVLTSYFQHSREPSFEQYTFWCQKNKRTPVSQRTFDASLQSVIDSLQTVRTNGAYQVIALIDPKSKPRPKRKNQHEYDT